jgi:hypothetical protein
MIVSSRHYNVSNQSQAACLNRLFYLVVTNDIIIDLNSVSAIDSKAEISLSGLGWTAELIPLQTPTEESLIRDIGRTIIRLLSVLNKLA